MRYAKIREMDTTNTDSGIFVSMFCQGCHFHCKGCWNESTWDFNNGNEWTKEVEDKMLLELCNKDYIKGLSLLGGEPLCNENYKTELQIAKRFKELYPNKLLYLWTGYTHSALINDNKSEILEYVDCLIEGRYVEELRDLSLKLRGSKNQNILKKGVDF